MRNVRPVSQLFGVDRGQPVDRYYIEKFLNENKKYIQGTVVEIGDDTYARKYGMNITRQEILHLTSDNPRATIIGDLTNQKTLKNQIADCFICTQTLNFIYDVKSAIEGIYFMLKDKGCALVTVSGISQISRYDMERWGDFWRFTDKSISGIFSEVFGSENIQLHTYGNVLSSVALLEGISAEELSEDELLFNDNVYQVIIAVKAIKK
ncbi:MAG: hypothetical protein AMS27_09115 [Bacteroides sp. SM23_62_1]|nr:MAG: hypothetical protein AMS27_09115 [Bacteroides sp. SM23_62_1]